MDYIKLSDFKTKSKFYKTILTIWNILATIFGIYVIVYLITDSWMYFIPLIVSYLLSIVALNTEIIYYKKAVAFILILIGIFMSGTTWDITNTLYGETSNLGITVLGMILLFFGLPSILTSICLFLEINYKDKDNVDS